VLSAGQLTATAQGIRTFKAKFFYMAALISLLFLALMCLRIA